MNVRASESVVFTRAQAEQVGVSWRSKRAHRVLPGIYTLGDPTSLDVRLAAARLAGGPDALFAGATALHLYGVWLPATLDALPSIDLWLPRDTCGPRLGGLRVYHTSQLFESQRSEPWPCVDVAEAFLQTVPYESEDDAVVTLDSMMRRQAPLTTINLMHHVLTVAKSMSGVRAARKALASAAYGTDSAMETRTRLALLRAGLPSPVVNHKVRTAGRTFYLDLAYVSERVAVEYDGADHVADRTQMDGDRRRRRLLEDAGWRVITITSADLLSPQRPFIASIRAALAR
jgi:very-short-patch-repair endonuclease